MRKETLIRKIVWITITLLLVAVYLVAYLFPAVIDINRTKRAVKDRELKVRDFKELKSTISLIDKKEERVIKQSASKFWQRIPIVKTGKNVENFIRGICQHIQKTAEKEGIKKLLITTDDNEPVILGKTAGLRKDDENKILRQVKFLGKTNKESELSPGILNYLSGLPGKVLKKTIFLGFPGKLNNALRLINGLPYFNYHIEEEKIVVSAGKFLPFFLVKLKLYYRDESLAINNNKDTFQENVSVDFHSPILLQPVYINYLKIKLKKRLPPYWGRTIFIEKSGGK